MARPVRRDLHERFRRVVEAAVERADREHAEHMARLRPRRRTKAETRRAAGGRVIFRPAADPVPEPAEPW